MDTKRSVRESAGHLRSVLSRYPRLERLLRQTYLHLLFALKGDWNFRLALSESVSIKRAESWGCFPIMNGATFYGYYDKPPWNSNGDAYLCHRIIDNNRVEMVLLKKGDPDPLIIGQSKTWTYQQGAMLQWLPGKEDHILVYNTMQSSKIGCCIQEIKRGKKRFLPWPVQAVHPKGHYAISLNYTRLMTMNPEYGYTQSSDNFMPSMSKSEDGLWRVDLHDGAAELIVSIDRLLDESHRGCMLNANHGVNHVMFSPSGRRFVFIHRWLSPQYSRYSRLYLMDVTGGGLKLLLDADHVSHYCWLDEDHLLTYATTSDEGKGYHQINVDDNDIKTIGKGNFDIFGDGHPSLSPNGQWVVTDTYPDAARIRRLLLWNLSEEHLVEVGRFYSPVSFENEQRCDLHPRWHPTEPLLSIDSAHEGVRRTYVLDVGSIVGRFSHE
jgi:hypothetical protein